MRSVILLFVIMVASTLANPAYAFDSEEAHPRINEFAVNQSNLGEFLSDELKFKNGVDTEINGQEIISHFRTGGTAEDEEPISDFFPARPLTHFHDPLQPWEDAGLWGTTLSALIWAQGYHPDIEAAVLSNVNGWEHARWAFYTALALGNQPEYWAETFKTLGQVMHLNSDMAVPAHVRNDGHMETLIPYYKSHFEKYTERTLSGLSFNGLPFQPGMEIFSRFQPHDQAPFPVSALWDIDRYTGDNPEITFEPMIGLAEYTNANFFSEGTIFSDYPNPAIDDTNYPNIDWEHPEVIDAEDGKQDYRIYIYKYLDNGQTVQSHRLAALGYLGYELLESDFEILYPVILDDVVYGDYAAKLVPRAVGYASTLLDYFFRGRIAVKGPSVTMGPDGSITDLFLSIKNATPPLDPSQPVEPFGSGTIELFVSYITPDNTREYYNGGTIYSPADYDDPINFEYQDVAVDLSNAPIPAGAKELSLTVVFRGTLGNEINSVAAKVYSFDNSRIAYYHQPDGQPNTSNIHTVSPDGLKTFDVTAMTVPNPWYFTPAWSRDGTKMAFEEEGCTSLEPDSTALDEPCPAEDYYRDIVVIDVQSGRYNPLNVLHVLNNDGRPVANPSFSPDGTMVAALVQNQNGMYLYGNIVVFDLVSDSAEVITTLDPERTDLYGSRPSWSPTGDWIAYALYHQYDQENGVWKREGDLFLVSPDGSAEVRLTDDEFINMQPSWSPDGQWLVYSSDRDGEQSMDIWIMDRNGGNNTRLYDCSPASCYSPTFSPDGLQVAFSNGSSIYTVNVDGDPLSLQEIAVPGYATGGLTWSPFIAEPSIEVQSDPPTITAFGTATLSWQSEGAGEVLISGIPDSQPAKGSISVSPDSTTVYTLTAVGPTGSGEARATVRVE